MSEVDRRWSPPQVTECHDHHGDDGEHHGGGQRTHHERCEHLHGQPTSTNLGVATTLVAGVGRQPGQRIGQRCAIPFGVNERVSERRERCVLAKFLERVNEAVRTEHPGVLMIAEEATAWSGVSKPVAVKSPPGRMAPLVQAGPAPASHGSSLLIAASANRR
jgi:hypothetical protein